MSTVLSEQEQTNKRRSRDAMMQVAVRFVGVLSAIIIAGGVGIVIYKKFTTKPELEWDYVNKEYGADHKSIPGSERAPKSSPGATTTVSPEAKRRYDDSNIVDMTRRDSGRIIVPSSNQTDIPTPSSPAKVEANVRSLESKKEAICQGVKEFFEAKTVSEMLTVVRDARRVRPLMEDFYARNPMERHAWSGVGTIRQVEEPGYHFDYVEAKFEGAPSSYVLVEDTEVGFLVDWESAIRYSELGWKQFLEQRPSRPTLMRLIASKPGENDFPPTEGLGARLVLRLQHPQEAGIVYGVFDPADHQMQPLLDQLASSQWRDAPVTVRVAFPAGSGSGNRVDINSVEGKGWLILKNTPRD